jgi:hypothetical protein
VHFSQEKKPLWIVSERLFYRRLPWSALAPIQVLVRSCGKMAVIEVAATPCFPSNLICAA